MYLVKLFSKISLTSKNYSFLIAILLIAVTALGQSPVISSFSPTSGVVGTVVTITGSGFSGSLGSNEIYFGNMRASIVFSSPTQLTVQVPAGAISGRLSYTNLSNNLAVISNRSFLVSYPSVTLPSMYNSTAVDITSSSAGSICHNCITGANAQYSFLDVNSDGKPDILSGVNSSQVLYSINGTSNSTGISNANFTALNINAFAAYSPNAFLVGDFNGDAKLDMGGAQVGQNGQAYTNTGVGATPAFTNAQNNNFSLFGWPTKLNINTDGKIDIFATYSIHDGFLQWTPFFNNSTLGGTVSFNSSYTSSGTYLGARLVTDFNQDGFSDVICGSRSTAGAFGVVLFRNTGSALAQTAVTGTLSGFAVSAHSYDLNSDSKEDFIFATSSGVVNIYPNLAAANATSLNLGTRVDLTYTGMTGITGGAVSDINNDGLLDVVVSSNLGLIAFLNTSSGATISFGSGIVLANTAQSQNLVSLEIVDLNNDGKFEVVGKSSSTFRIIQYFVPPTITTTSTLTSFSTCQGTPSSAQSISVTGTNLSADIVVTAPTGYQVSLNGSTFASTVNLVQSGGNVSTTIYVRLTGSTAGTFNNSLSLTSTGATSQSVSLQGITSVSAPTITINPTSTITTCLNNVQTISVNGNNVGSFQWFSNNSNSNVGGTSLGSANGAQTGTLTVNTGSVGTTYYYAVVTNGCGSASSNVSTVNVIESVAGTASVNNNTICPATNVQLTLTGNTGSIQWQSSSDNVTFNNIASANTSPYTTANINNTIYFRAIVTNSTCPSATSNSVTVTTVDNTVPTITAPNNITVNANGSCQATSVSLGTPTTADNCSVASFTNDAPASFPLGVNTVTWTATDVAGNTATATQTVTVVDNTNPSLVAPANITVSADNVCNAGVPNLGSPIASDNCSLTSLVNDAMEINGVPTFQLGTTTVTWTATDAAGNSTTATQTVTVVDNTNPVISGMPSNIVINTNNCSEAVTWTAPTATDNCSFVLSSSHNSGDTFNAGVTTVTYTATDGSNNVATATFTVSVLESTPPTITAPAALTVYADANCVATGVSLGSATTSDNCSGEVATNDAPGTFQLGNTTVTWTVTDASGNTATATQTVTVSDTTRPTITAPSAVTVNADANCVATSVSLGTPTTADNCSVASVTDNGLASYPLGNTTVTWTVTDGSGNTNTATQTVTVVDNTNPVISGMPSNMTVNNDAGSCDAVVSWTAPTATDNCSVTLTSDYNIGDVFPIGTTTVTYTATDGSNNAVTATFDITVVDNELPTIIAPAAVTVYADANCVATGVSLGSATTSDNCSGEVATNDAPGTFQLGNTTVTWTVTDASGNTATATQTVTVSDTTRPTITAPSAVTVNADANCVATSVSLGTPTTADNCSVASVTDNGLASYPLGNTTVTWTVTDGSGNTNTATQTVTVVDNTNPVISGMPSNMTVNNDAGSCDAVVSWTAPTATDNCSVTLTSDYNIGDVFPIGTTTVTYTATDGSNNAVTATFDITVVDNELPTITAPAAVTVYADANCLATGVTLGSATTSDNCSGEVATNDAPGTFLLGNTTVTWTVTDASGNTATATQTVTVSDTTRPTITAPSAVTVNADANCVATSVSLGTPTTADNCSVASVTDNGLASYPLGNTTVTWTVTDGSGNTNTATQTVTVVDNTNPVISGMPSNMTVNNDAGSCDAVVSWTAPTATDNCSVTLTSDYNIGDVFPIGTTTVTYTATDGSNNAVTATFDITVVDNELPTITAPTNLSLTANTNCEAFGVNLGTPSTSDNCSGEIATNDAPYVYQLGTTIVTWTVTDASGNIATTTQAVTVSDNTGPYLVAPSDMTVSADNNCTATIANLGTPVAIDNCTNAVTSNDAPASFPLGNTTVTWTATDAAGNSTTATQTITVIDNTNPTITAPANVTASADNNCVATTVTLGTATTADNCTVASVTNNAPASFPLGTTTVTWTVTDGSGNTATATQTVTVNDNTNPTITAPANVTVNANGTCNAFNVALGTATTADNCSVASVTNDAPGTFPLGTTTVTWTVTDGSGNIATATQTVTVVDNANPSLVAPSNMTVSAGNACTVTIANLGTPVATDNCTLASVTNNAPASFPLGNTTVTWTATDAAGNSTTATQTITVIDNTNPTITAPANVTASANNNCVATTVTLGTATTADNCTVASVTNNAPASFPLGTTTVTWTVTDGSGNTATATQTVTVNDNTNPTITAPANVTVNANGTCNAFNVALGTATTADNCSVASVTNDAPGTFPLGTTTVTWTVTDGSGNIATATQTVTVVDNANPSLVAPANMTVSAGNACTATIANLGTPVATDNCTLASVTNNAPASFPLGNTTVTWTATDAAGNSTTATQTITVIDNTNPTITAPANVTASADNNCVATTVSLGTATTADNCTVASVTNNAPASFPLGTTTVTWTVTDGSGNTATATQTVTVNDNTNPTITAPANVTVNANGTCNAFNVALGTATTADNCSVASVTNNAPGTFPLGTTTVTWTVTDGSGNIATATQTVTVVDNANPSLVAPANMTVSAGNACTATIANLGTPVATDNCTLASVTNNAPASFPLGNTTVTWTATDAAGNSTTATQTITVIDNTNPTITAPANVTASANNNCVATTVTLGTATTADNCTVASVTNNAPASFPLGTTTVTWTVTDGSGNTATATQTVTVNDNTNPTITAPANVTVNANGTCNAFNVALGTATTADNCSVASVTNNAPGTFPLGTTTVTWTVTDGSGNIATATQTVTVVDNANPSLVAPANMTVSAGNACTATIANLGTPVATDNCTLASVTNNAPASFPLGNTTVTWTATDAAGNSTTATQTITVIDNTNPTITAPANVTASADNNCVATTVTLGTATTADNCTVASVTNNAPASFPLGTTTVTWTVTDGSGNTATATQTVTVNDNTNPTITAPANVTVNANGTCNAFNVALGTATTADNCSVASVTNNAPGTFPLGTTTVTWTVTDGSGNIATATQTVTVVDNANPSLVAPANMTVSAGNACTATIANLGTPVATDNCTLASVTNNAPASFPLGNTTVTWTATDAAGNSTTATQTITVIDNTNPTITAPANVTASADNNCVATTVTLGTATTADNCTVASVTNNAPASFPLGTTTVTWTVTDGSGNTATATQTVTVNDNTNPTITAPANVTVNANGTCNAFNVALGTATTADNCSVASVTNNAPGTFPLGTTTVTWTVTDGSGNIATATQTVTVNDTVSPIVIAPSNLIAYTTTQCEATNVTLGNPVVIENCGIQSIVNNAPLTYPLGTTVVTWTITDNGGNITTADQIVTVMDTTQPTLMFNNLTVVLDINGNAEINIQDVDNGSTDNCGIELLTLSQYNFDCSHVGSNAVIMTATDYSGNTSIGLVTVTIQNTGIDLDLDGIPDECDTLITTEVVEIPNGFTPDGDGFNDYFVIPISDNYNVMTLSIYNRYGNLVYENSNYTNDWDGKSSLNDQELPDDTYFYILTLDGELRQGYVYINRIQY